MKSPSTTQENGDTIRTVTWIRTDNVEKYVPITQVYGICFDDSGNILTCRESSDGKWQIPGGTPEKGESIEETLIREVEEEVDVEIRDIHPLGVQRVDSPDNPSSEGDLFYQVRCVCRVKNVNDQTPDPASGNTWERKFVPAEEITDYVQWGEIGDAMFKDAIDLEKS